MARPVDDDAQAALERRALVNSRALLDHLETQEVVRRRKERNALLAIFLTPPAAVLAFVLYGVMTSPRNTVASIDPGCERRLVGGATQQMRAEILAKYPAVSTEQLSDLMDMARGGIQGTASILCARDKNSALSALPPAAAEAARCQLEVQSAAAAQARTDMLRKDPSIAQADLARHTAQVFRDTRSIGQLQCAGAY
jgi:hypothetical protein